MARMKTARTLDENYLRLLRAVNKWGARIIPIILIGLIGYSAWAFAAALVFNYLILGNPRHLRAGIPILIVYIVVGVLMIVCYLRLLYTVFTHPGYVPLPAEEQQHREKARSSPQRTSPTTNQDSQEKPPTQNQPQNTGYLNRTSVSDSRTGPPAGLEKFYQRDIFECAVDGLPRWCSGCQAWKPDRSHHSSEVGRCVYKMDHFCPWAGGIISETSFKFFIQFLVYGALFNTLLVTALVYYSVQEGRQGRYHVNWIVAIALAGVLLLFSTAMGLTSMSAISRNETSTDILWGRQQVHHFAVLIPNPQMFAPHPATAPILSLPPPPIVASPGPELPQQSHHHATRYHTVTFPLPTSSNPDIAPTTTPRTFAILSTPQGTKPYRLQSILANFKSIMGNSILEWLLPIRHSPCYRDRLRVERRMAASREEDAGTASETLMYEVGPVVEKMIIDAGLQLPPALMKE